MEQCKKQLEAHLFILHPQLRPALLLVQSQCVSNTESKLMAAIEPLTTYTLQEFKTVHFTKMKLVSALCIQCLPHTTGIFCYSRFLPASFVTCTCVLYEYSPDYPASTM